MSRLAFDSDRRETNRPCARSKDKRERSGGDGCVIIIKKKERKIIKKRKKIWESNGMVEGWRKDDGKGTEETINADPKDG